MTRVSLTLAAAAALQDRLTGGSFLECLREVVQRLRFLEELLALRGIGHPGGKHALLSRLFAVLGGGGGGIGHAT